MVDTNQETFPVLKASLTQQCVRCLKKKMYKVVAKCQDGREIPYQMILIGGHNFDCLVVEDRYIKDVEGRQDDPENYDHIYMVYRCEDPFCLLSFMREGMTGQWLINYKEKQEEENNKARFKAALERRNHMSARRILRKKRK